MNAFPLTQHEQQNQYFKNYYSNHLENSSSSVSFEQQHLLPPTTQDQVSLQRRLHQHWQHYPDQSYPQYRYNRNLSYLNYGSQQREGPPFGPANTPADYATFERDVSLSGPLSEFQTTTNHSTDIGENKFWRKSFLNLSVSDISTHVPNLPSDNVLSTSSYIAPPILIPMHDHSLSSASAPSSFSAHSRRVEFHLPDTRIKTYHAYQHQVQPIPQNVIFPSSLKSTCSGSSERPVYIHDNYTSIFLGAAPEDGFSGDTFASIPSRPGPSHSITALGVPEDEGLWQLLDEEIWDQVPNPGLKETGSSHNDARRNQIKSTAFSRSSAIHPLLLKKPLNPFMLFCKEKRAEYVRRYCKFRNSGITLDSIEARLGTEEDEEEIFQNYHVPEPEPEAIHSATDVTKLLASDWKKLSDEQKYPYQRQAALLKESYFRKSAFAKIPSHLIISKDAEKSEPKNNLETGPAQVDVSEFLKPIEKGDLGDDKVGVYKRPQKDPAAPKYPINAFGFFCRHKKAQSEDQNSIRKKSHKARSEAEKAACPGVSVLWKGLTPQERVPFELQAKADQTRYRKEMKLYQSKFRKR